MTQVTKSQVNQVHYHVVGGYPFIATGHIQAIEEYVRLVDNYISIEGIQFKDIGERSTVFNDGHAIYWFACECGAPGLANLKPEEPSFKELFLAIIKKARKNFLHYSRTIFYSRKGNQP